MMNIIPVSSGIGSLGPVGGGPSIKAPEQKAGSGFADFFKDALKDIEGLETLKEQDSYNLAVGEVDNLAEIAVTAQEYEIALQMLVEIRNKILDSYSEIMRMNI
ncbi:hypothetical protein FACS1894191_8600 [Clostridia bacterium]|nr:hypothetical protein FACS1894191_8600 [Clostridia bacterium]